MMTKDIQRSKILIIDDLSVNIKFVDKLLKMAGYENIISMTDSRRAVQIIEQEMPHLVLLDLEMPGVDGFTILEKLSLINKEKKISVIVLTAMHEAEYRHRALDLGANDYLTKPLDSKEMLLRISNILKGNLLQRLLLEKNQELNYLVDLRTKEVENTQIEIIRRLGTAAEFKDNETAMHIVRMSKYCELLAEKSNMPKEKCKLILFASPMHDIGKIGIPDSILLKPSKLNEDEMKIMQTHAAIGGKIIGDHSSDLLKTARIIAETHHEKWDGSGYPLGLRGEEIPIEGRITAIADVFDALTSKRVYKNSWTTEQAIDYLIQNKGIHFDVNLVNIFIENLSEIILIKETFLD